MRVLPLMVCSLLCLVESKTYLFPIPQTVEWTGYGSILADQFTVEGQNNLYLHSAVDRYLRLIKMEKWKPVQVPADNTWEVILSGNMLLGLKLEVMNATVKLDMGIDESYGIYIPKEGGYGTIRAATWVGALRGLETFSQLIEKNNNNLVVHSAHIEDAPTYVHRGILLDTSRQFYPVNSILKTLDAQAYNKMNVFHWHITDSQSWPLYLESHPELALLGAYSPLEIYHPEDVKRVIHYAEERGIRVILELDMPAHTASIGESHPAFITCRDQFWANYAAEPPAGQLNPIRSDVFDLVKDIVAEGTEIFPDSLYHTGGDEINDKCWETDPDILAYLNTHNMTTKELWFQWTNRLLQFVINECHKRPILWEDPVRDGGCYPKETIVQTWTTPASHYTSLGYDVIISNYDYFYLDCGHGGWVGNDDRYVSPTQSETPDDQFNYGGSGGSWCAPFKTWQRIYSYDMTYNTTSPGKVLGGEVAMWSEQTGPTVLDGRLWPRSAAAAELYWSGSYDNQGQRRTLESVSERFYDWGYRLQTRGILSEPTQPKWCALNPGQCDLNPPNFI
ncbi:glycoside hydrolase superfamily [Pilobolus umbonatus]|nr:glycoside hydrolase superfamily [Pilobolus umbonatus]